LDGPRIYLIRYTGRLYLESFGLAGFTTGYIFDGEEKKEK
jgi:hypothetical protein